MRDAPAGIASQQVARRVVGEDRHAPFAGQHLQRPQALDTRGHQHCINAGIADELPACLQLPRLADQVRHIALALASGCTSGIARCEHRPHVFAECVIARKHLQLVVLDHVVAGDQHVMIEPGHGLDRQADRGPHRAAQHGAVRNADSGADARYPETGTRPEIIRQHQFGQLEPSQETKPRKLTHHHVPQLSRITGKNASRDRQFDAPTTLLPIAPGIDLGLQVIGRDCTASDIVRLHVDHPDRRVLQHAGLDIARDHRGPRTLLDRHRHRGGRAAVLRCHPIRRTDVVRRLQSGRPVEKFGMLRSRDLATAHCKYSSSTWACRQSSGVVILMLVFSPATAATRRPAPSASCMVDCGCRPSVRACSMIASSCSRANA